MTSSRHHHDLQDTRPGGRLAAALLLIAGALAACTAVPLEARGSLAPEIDLTRLSLEELLDLEVIPACDPMPRPGPRGVLS